MSGEEWKVIQALQTELHKLGQFTVDALNRIEERLAALEGRES